MLTSISGGRGWWMPVKNIPIGPELEVLIDAIR